MVDVNDNGGNDAGSVTVLQESLDSVRAVGRVHHTEAANITDIRVPGRRRSKAVPLELSDALEITPKTKNWNLAAIEVVLKQKRFRQYDTFRPTSQNMTLSYDRFYESIRLRELPQFPGEYEYVSYSIRQLVAELIKFTHDPAH